MAFGNLSFSETDARIHSGRLKAAYENFRRAAGEAGYRLAPADPVRLILETIAAANTQISTDIDLTGKGNLLYFAKEDTIEYLGDLYGERGKRLEASYALTTIRYHLAGPRSVRTVIPKGSRVTADNKIFFATMKSIEIAPGDLYGDAEAQAQTAGFDGDGFEIGAIKNMVDLFPFVAAAENLTVSSGGAGREELEPYRERLRMVPESFSVAGPDGAYEFWARTANPGIVDTRVWMPDLDMVSFANFLAPWGITDAGGFYEAINNYYRESGTGPGNVNVACLMRDGELPSEEVKEQVFNVLSDKARRPLTDYVHIVDPAPVEYDIDLQYWIAVERATEAASIIQAVNNAVERFIQYQQSRLGLDIVPDLLHSMIMETGVKRIDIISPVFTVLQPSEVGLFSGQQTVTYEGLEDA
jgi:phage-related baseplate assembly protein